MTRYIVHLHSNNFTAKNAEELLHRARELADYATIRDARVSSNYVEFDVTIPSERLSDLLVHLSKIKPVANSVEITDKEMDKEKSIECARSLFNEERYWECHEVLEGVWKKERGEEKKLLQGIILVCAAFVHSQKNEDDICFSILGRALDKLDAAKGVYHDIDIDRLKELMKNIARTKHIHYFKI